MIKEAYGTGETIEIAKRRARETLGVDETVEVNYEVIDLPIKKTLGLFGGTPAKIRAWIDASPAKNAEEFLREVLEKMGAKGIDLSTEEVEGGAVITLSGDGVGMVIGRRGETLDALQYLTGLVANHDREGYFRINLNTGNYREKREKTLEGLAKKMAFKAIKTGRNQFLEPMNPYERRIIHKAVQQVTGAKSWSEGEDTKRHVVIGTENSSNFTRPQRSGYDRNRGGFDNNRRGGSSRFNSSSEGGYRKPYNRDRDGEGRYDRTSRPSYNNSQSGERPSRPSYNNNQSGERPSRPSYNNNQSGERPSRPSYNNNQSGERPSRSPSNQGNAPYSRYGKIDRTSTSIEPKKDTNEEQE